jgi:outer membrane protein
MLAAAAPAGSQTVKLNLQDAEALALKNHPQVLAAQNATSAMDQRVLEARSAYYPMLAGDATGSQANTQARIGAGFLTNSRLFNRVGTGFTLSQLITDSGRTPNLVAQSRLQVTAAQQNYQATRYDVLLAVNQSYFDTLRAQATVKVAQQTVDARQTIVDQITALYNNQLRSQLDVSFVEVNLSEAKLLLLQAQDQVQAAFAQLTRALGGQQPATYELADEPLPPSPPANPDALVAQALAARPELAALTASRDAAYRFEVAEKDLSKPNASLVGVGGYIPYINQITLPRRIPAEYEGVAVNVQIPVLNGGLFKARREEAHYHVMEADQHLRDEQQRVVRDVRTAWAGATVAYQRLAVTAQFLRQATLAQDLAQGRYSLGLAPIVELTQAQLNVTAAEIENLSAKYNYQIEYATLQYDIGALR